MTSSHTTSESDVLRVIGGQCTACPVRSFGAFMECQRDDCEFVLNESIEIPVQHKTDEVAP